MQTDSYINNENTNNIIPPPSTENSQKKIKRHHTFQYQLLRLSIRKKIFILGDSKAKNIQGYDIPSKLKNKHKLYVCSFS